MFAPSLTCYDELYTHLQGFKNWFHIIPFGPPHIEHHCEASLHVVITENKENQNEMIPFIRLNILGNQRETGFAQCKGVRSSCWEESLWSCPDVRSETMPDL